MKTKPAETWTFAPIGAIRTSFKEKFGTPRQPGLAANARGVIELNRGEQLGYACRHLESFSHLWVIFVFHAAFKEGQPWKPMIRPPRLGGAKKVGVLASRSPHRPNPIGLSVVKIEKVDLSDPENARIEVSGVDILDGSPILDIKPYIPYAEAIPDAIGGWAVTAPEQHPVEFSEQSLRDIEARVARHPDLKRMIAETLAQDPRPAAQRRKFERTAEATQGRRFGFLLLDYDVKWKIDDQRFVVLAVEDLVDGKPRTLAKDRL